MKHLDRNSRGHAEDSWQEYQQRRPRHARDTDEAPRRRQPLPEERERSPQRSESRRSLPPPERRKSENVNKRSSPRGGDTQSSRTAAHTAPMRMAPLSPSERKKQEKRKRAVYLGFTAFCALAIIVMAVVLRGVSDNRAYNDYMEQARGSYYSASFDSALTYLRKAGAINATDECLAMTAQCYESMGNYDKALETLRRMDVSNPQVSGWIAELESRKNVISQSGLVVIASKQYKSDTTGLALDNMGLGNNVIEEILQLYSLDNLSLAGNNISDISGLSRLGGLVTLNLSGNLISDVSALGSLSGLRTLYLDDNPVTDLSPLSSLTNLTTLSIKGIRLTDGQLKALADALPNCAIHSESVEKEIQDISFGGVTFKTDVTELNLSGMGLQNISAIAGCKQLQKLDISGNYISDLSPLMDLPQLRWLNASNNAITDLRPLMGISSLNFLNVSGNHFSGTVPLGNITSLTELHLSDNMLTDLSGLGKLKSLQTLGLANCGIRDEMLMPLFNLTGLRSLNLENNLEISGEAMDSLKTSLYACQVTHSELSYMVNIDGYSIRNDAMNIDLSGLNIYDISNFRYFTNPQTVNLARNNISNLYMLPESPNRMLVRNLDLSYNALFDITPIASLMNLETLNLSYNLMISSELPLLALRNLRQLDVTGTSLSAQQVKILKDTLTGCVVISNYGW